MIYDSPSCIWSLNLCSDPEIFFLNNFQLRQYFQARWKQKPILYTQYVQLFIFVSVRTVKPCIYFSLLLNSLSCRLLLVQYLTNTVFVVSGLEDLVLLDADNECSRRQEERSLQHCLLEGVLAGFSWLWFWPWFAQWDVYFIYLKRLYSCPFWTEPWAAPVLMLLVLMIWFAAWFCEKRQSLKRSPKSSHWLPSMWGREEEEESIYVSWPFIYLSLSQKP